MEILDCDHTFFRGDCLCHYFEDSGLAGIGRRWRYDGLCRSTLRLWHVEKLIFEGPAVWCCHLEDLLKQGPMVIYWMLMLMY